MAEDNSQRWERHFVENVALVWLHSTSNEEDPQYQKTLGKLRTVANNVATFTTLDASVDYMDDAKCDKFIVIISLHLDQDSVSEIHDLSYVQGIYFFFEQKFTNARWMQNFAKVKGISSSINLLCLRLKVEIYDLNHDLTQISVIPASASIELDELDPSFVYTKYLKEHVSTAHSAEHPKEDLIKYFRFQYADNVDALEVIDEYERTYPQSSPMWWYMRDCFLRATMTRALRTHDIIIHLILDSFMGDLHRQLVKLRSEASSIHPFVVYRGQGMSIDHFEQILEAQHGLLVFNDFLPTTTSRAKSVSTAQRASANGRPRAVLFRMEINPETSSIPFATFKDQHHSVDSDQEVLFSMQTVFRINDVEEIEDDLWQVTLTLVADNDKQLVQICEKLQEKAKTLSGLHALGEVFIEMKIFDQAYGLFHALTEVVPETDQQGLASLYRKLGYVSRRIWDLVSALSFYHKSLKMHLSFLSRTDVSLAECLNDVGATLELQGRYDEAVEYYQQALELHSDAEKPDLLAIAKYSSKVGLSQMFQGLYDEALENFEQALTIRAAHLPPDHLELAVSYNDLAVLYQKTDNKLEALDFYSKENDVHMKQSPPDYTSIISNLMTSASLMADLARHEEAVEHASKAADMASNHLEPDDSLVDMTQSYLERIRNTA